MSKSLDQMAEEATIRYQNEQAMFFCECAINLMMTTMSVKAVRQYLKDQRKILKEWE